MIEDKEPGANPDRAQQNARGSDVGQQVTCGDMWAGPFTAGPCMVFSDDVVDGAAVFDVTGQPYLLIADDMAVGGRDGALATAQYVAGMLNSTQPQVAVIRDPADPEHVDVIPQPRLGAWDGPFTVDTPTVTRGGGVPVLDGAGHDFCSVMVDDCAGKNLAAAKARATRIAEALNAQHERVEITLRGEDLADTLRAIVRQEVAALNRRNA